MTHRTYFGFLASSMFAVVVFYLFAAFRALPDVAAGRYAGAEAIAKGFEVCQYLIVAFSVFFTLYSNSAFVKSRKRELGVLALLGAERRQLSLLLFGESMLVGITSITAGLGLGALFARLFVMAIDRILASPEPLRFVVQVQPMVTTALAYLGIFTAVSVVNIMPVNVDQVIQLVKAPHKPKTPPTYSRLAVAFGIACIAAGYIVAWNLPPIGVVLGFLPVTAVVCVGTHILFTQGSVAVLRSLQRRKSIYYRRTNLLTIADLVFKMKDNARILAQVAILSAVVLTASGVVYTLVGTPDNITATHVRAISFLLSAEEEAVQVAAEFQARLAQAGADVVDSATMRAVRVLIPAVSKDQPGIVVRESDYNRWARQTGKPEVAVGYGDVVRAMVNPGGDLGIGKAGAAIVVKAGDIDLSFMLAGAVDTTLIAGYQVARFTLICDDQRFDELVRSLPASQQGVWFSCEVSNWKGAVRAEQVAMRAIPADYEAPYLSRIQAYTRMRGSMQMAMLIAMFIAFLFFLAAGSMLYFRFFLEIQEDQARYVALRRMGLSWAEIKQMVTQEMAVLFFTPWTAAFAHQMVALRAYSTMTPMMPLEVWKYGVAAAGIFLTLQTVYFLLARAAYLEELAPAVR